MKVDTLSSGPSGQLEVRVRAAASTRLQSSSSPPLRPPLIRAESLRSAEQGAQRWLLGQRQRSEFRSLAKVAVNPYRIASNGIDPPPAVGSMHVPGVSPQNTPKYGAKAVKIEGLQVLGEFLVCLPVAVRRPFQDAVLLHGRQRIFAVVQSYRVTMDADETQEPAVIRPPSVASCLA